MSQYFSQSPALPAIEMRQATQSDACYHLHSHDEFSFGVIDAGQADYLNGGQRQQIGYRDTVLINPGDMHACNPHFGQWSYRMLFLNCQWLAQLQHESGFSSALDYHAFSRTLLQSGAHYQLFDGLFGALAQGQAQLNAESLLIEFLLPLFQGRVDESRSSDRLYLAKEYLLSQLDASPDLTSLANLVGISRYHLIRSFKQVYGLSPHAYLIDARIKQAKIELRRGQALADVALNLGFSDQSHFQHQFKKRLGVTPRRYQSAFV